jgi:hypothetical protein
MDERDDSQNREGREDWFLQTLVRWVEDGRQLSITLSVGGMLISGTLISYSEYLKLFGDQMRGMTVPELQDLLTRTFADLAEKAEHLMCEREREEEIMQSLGEEPEDEFVLAYVHLKDTKFFLAAGAGIPTQGGTLWRGKIASVDGFSLGSLTASPAQTAS